MKAEIFAQVADAHFIIEPGLTQICRLEREPAEEERPEEPVKLLEVNRRTIPVGLRGIYLRPDLPAGIHFPCVVYDVTPEEFQQIQQGELQLPTGLRMTECRKRPRRTRANGSRRNGR